jgi:hypothetical protein|tara:strand:- start:504 stop:635 length:132 start_codon:yes stop_codon:yes gene_type:complete
VAQIAPLKSFSGITIADFVKVDTMIAMAADVIARWRNAGALEL